MAFPLNLAEAVILKLSEDVSFTAGLQLLFRFQFLAIVAS